VRSKQVIYWPSASSAEVKNALELYLHSPIHLHDRVLKLRIRLHGVVLTYRVKVKVKVKLSLCLTKHHAVKTYWGVEL